ncbi:MAG TPA: hypothetical protein VF661_13290 [Actinomycetales bacterium]|jgi:hypothetical protein
MQRTDQRTPSIAGISDAVGSAVGAGFGALARLRAAKSIHPRGAVIGALLERLEHRRTGVDWVDRTEPVQVVVRISRSLGLPAPLPDVLGMAIRAPLDPDGFGDLLLATGARQPVARHLFLPYRDPVGATFTSVLPFSTPVGLRMVAALPVDASTYLLAMSTVQGPWAPFARLLLESAPATQPDESIDFDPVAHQLPGLGVPDALGRLRRPSYLASRAGRRHPWPPRG